MSWFDYDNQIPAPGEFPKHLEVVLVNPDSGIKYEFMGKSSDGSAAVKRLDNGEVKSFHCITLKPLDWNKNQKRKIDMSTGSDHEQRRDELLQVATQLAAGYGSYCSENNIPESEVNMAAIEQAKDLISKVDDEFKGGE